MSSDSGNRVTPTTDKRPNLSSFSGSRPPKTNSTGPRRTAITNKAGVKLRQELIDPLSTEGANAVDWTSNINQWESYIKETRNTSMRFDEIGGDGTVYNESTHRWSPDYQEQRYAKLKDMERGIDEFYTNPTTGLITLTASGDNYAPVDHLHELLDGRRTALSALRRSLSDRTWDYWWVLEPHPGSGENAGYLHLHLAVVVEGPVIERQLRPAVESHLRNCAPAGRDAHTNEKAIDIRDPREIGNIAAYLNSYLGDYMSDPLEAPECRRAGNAILWATQKRETGASKRLRQMMQGETVEPESDWELVAMVDGDGDEHPIDSSVPGGVDTEKTVVHWPDSSDPP